MLLPAEVEVDVIKVAVVRALMAIQWSACWAKIKKRHYKYFSSSTTNIVQL